MTTRMVCMENSLFANTKGHSPLLSILMTFYTFVNLLRAHPSFPGHVPPPCPSFSVSLCVSSPVFPFLPFPVFSLLPACSLPVSSSYSHCSHSSPYPFFLRLSLCGLHLPFCWCVSPDSTMFTFLPATCRSFTRVQLGCSCCCCGCWGVDF